MFRIVGLSLVVSVAYGIQEHVQLQNADAVLSARASLLLTSDCFKAHLAEHEAERHVLASTPSAQIEAARSPDKLPHVRVGIHFEQ